MTNKPECPAEVWVYLACALFFLGLYKEAEEAASKGRQIFVYNVIEGQKCTSILWNCYK